MRVGTMSGALAAVMMTGLNVGVQGGAEKEVLQAQADRLRAVLASDAKATEPFVAEELWYCRSRGHCEDKASYLKEVAEARHAAINPVNTRIHVYGNTAMLTGQIEQMQGTPGRPKAGTGEPVNHFLILEMYVRRNGRWLLTKSQAIDPPDDPHRCIECVEAGGPANPTNIWSGAYLFGTKAGSEKDVLRSQAARFHATLAADPKAAATVVADELSYCLASGRCEDKAKYLQAVGGLPHRAPGGLKFLEMWTENAKVDVYSNTASVVGRLHQTITSDNKPSALDFLILEIYVNREGRWQLAGFMATDLPGWSPNRCSACRANP
jgi:hypothetical protein